MSSFSIAVISGLRTLMKLKVCMFFLFGRTLACYHCNKLSLLKIVNGWNVSEVPCLWCYDNKIKKIKTLCQSPQKKANLHCCMWFDYLSMLLLTQNKILSIVLSLRLFNCKILSIVAKFSLTSPLAVHLPYTRRFLPPSLTDQPSNQCFIAVKWFNHRPLSCKFFELAFLCLFFSHVNRLFCFMEIWYPPWQSLKNTYQPLSAPCHWQIMRYQTLMRYIWGYFSYFTGSLCNDRSHFFLLIIIMLIQFVGLFFGNKMLATSLGQVVGKKITTTLYSSVEDPVLQIRGGGGGGGWSSRPWNKGGILDLPL